MATPLKDLYSRNYYDGLTSAIAGVITGFNRDAFFEAIYTPAFHNMELKERMRHTTTVLHQFLPESYSSALPVLLRLVKSLSDAQGGNGGLPDIIFPDYIELYGLDHFEISVDALEVTTQFITCEFAVRPFLLKYGKAMTDKMLVWSTHENHKVRRFASEGIRPRLPWAMAVPFLKKDPEPILPILENLRNDPSEFVRRSVANNLNDIAKDHPDLVLSIARRWSGLSKETDAIIKHGCRTLLKKGHPEILTHYGLDHAGLAVTDLIISTPEVNINDSLEFSFNLVNETKENRVIRLEYAIYYLKANQQWSKKVFKISEKVCQPVSRTRVTRKQSFKLITTRTFYPGTHRLSVIINGSEQTPINFELLPEK